MDKYSKKKQTVLELINHVCGKKIKQGLLASLVLGSAVTGYNSAQATDLLKDHSDAIKPVTSTQNLPNFVNLVKQVKPAVVSITSRVVVGDNDDSMMENGFPNGDDNMNPFPFPFPFPMFPQQMPKQVAEARGSGFIISPDGYIVTNNHVVKGAKKITIALETGAKYQAKIIGRDSKTDLALLKIQSEKPLPFIQLGDSNGIEPGEWVIAVGDPYGLGGTVTAGIVSARGRDIGDTPYDSFIQVDAPINRGNSGGPLFSQDGKVIGVNTAILSPSGGSIGIGFAIPSNTVKNVVTQLEKTGHVTRGYLGVMGQMITPSMVKMLKLPPSEHGIPPKGVLIASVANNSPAEKAQLKVGDVILSLNDKKVENPRDLANQVAAITPNTMIDLNILRNGTRKVVKVQVGNLNEDTKSKKIPAPAPGSLGVSLSLLTPEIRQQAGIDEKIKGVIVTSIKNDSPADHAGLQNGDVIVSVNNQDVDKPEMANRLISSSLKTDKTVLLRILRDGQSIFIAVTLGDND